MASSKEIRSSRTRTAVIATALRDSALPGDLDGFDAPAIRAAATLITQAIAARQPGKPSLLIDSSGSGAGQRVTRLVIVNDDMPFLVDSVAAAVAARGLTIHRLLHPVLTSGADKDDNRQSLIYLECERVTARERASLSAEILAVLADVRAAVGDWPQMQSAMRSAAEQVIDPDGRALVEWLADGQFTILGHCRLAAGGHASNRLGVLRGSGSDVLSEATRKAAFAWALAASAEPLLVKAEKTATVHRRVPLDLIITAQRNGKRITALDVTAGLWTSAALATPPDQVPLLGTRLGKLADKLGFHSSGHAGKAFRHAVASLPRDLATSLDAKSLEDVALTAMSLIDRPRTRLLLVPDALGRQLVAFVWLPRDEMSTSRRLDIGTMLTAAADATLSSWSVDMRDDGVALLRYTLSPGPGTVPIDAIALDRQLVQMVRSWLPAVEAALAQRVTAGRAARLALAYGTAFPASFRLRCTPEEAAEDVLRLAALTGGDTRGARLYRLPEDPASGMRLRIYRAAELVVLSDAVPILENFGFRVLEEYAFSLEGGAHGHIHDLTLELPGADVESLLARRDVIEAAISGVLGGNAENDPFNALVTATTLDPRAAVLFRAWFRYLRQTGSSYGQTTVVEALKAAPVVTTALIELFDARHDPGRSPGRAEAEKAVSTKIEEALTKVTAIDEDRILRLYRSIALAVLRTNVFVPGAAEALAFKFDSALVPGLPAPVPWREIWVYSPRVEGIHLRSGPVARGGLRWSDRRDDFRTEVLGLMKAQVVKNAVIVPTGAKGGFYPKLLPSPGDREAWLAEGTEAYRIFIRALLSITDNIIDDKIVHPAGMVVLDGNDPYFVVAADKGTASFSNIANAVALDRGFWLGDAFASGGSHGYDHKVMGITARGAWVSVARHLAEAGMDVASDPVTVAGVGDMSGDVFGNAMLLSKSIRLVAAFDHRHIFLDPASDAKNGWAERKRLFALPRSSWADYDAKLISRGGGIFPRTQKSIPLSIEVQALLGLNATSLDPSGLITAILKSPVDLLFLGGIGTYVKARTQDNAEVGDRANDANRVNGDEIGARVIGEGANLGATQAGRIEYAGHGGRINTDFIDNSAGVDCSDNEVNIKIALNAEMAAGRLTLDKRNTLLATMTDEVAGIVLEDNRLQTLALSIAERGGPAAVPTFVRVAELLETSGRFAREVEGIDSSEALLRRGRDGHGLTRPELAVMLSHAKLALQEAIEKAPLAEDGSVAGDLRRSFPRAMARRFREAIYSHRLRREIVATELANRLVNRLGLAAPFALAEEEGAGLAQVTSGFVVIEQLFNLPQLWRDIDASPMAQAARLTLFTRVSQATRLHIANLLRNAPVDVAPSTLLNSIRAGVRRLGRRANGLMPEEARARLAALRTSLLTDGIGEGLAERVVALFAMDGAIGIAALAARSAGDEVATAGAYVRLGEALGLDWAKGAALRLSPSDPWERLLLAGLSRDFEQLRLDFIGHHCGATDPGAGVERWLRDQAPRIGQFRQLVARVRVVAQPTPAMLAQIGSQARVLLAQ